MKTETVKIYRCEHCKKYSISASTISRHEKYCRDNPLNKHKCFDFCENLLCDRKVENGKLYKEFTCKITGKKMYSYKLEKVASLSYEMMFLLSNKFEHAQRMPVECASFEAMKHLPIRYMSE